MPWPPRFLFVSGRISVDLAHTGRADAPHRERLAAPADLADWLAASSLGLTLPAVRLAELRAARDLRDVMWAALGAVLAGEPLPASVRAALNRAAERPDLAPFLAGEDERHGRAWAPSATAARALASIARDAVDLLSGSLRERIRECRNPRCPIVFVDLSRPGRRAWCSMRRCGNLAKTSRYRRSLER